MRCLIDSASDLIFIKGRDGAYLGCNKASEAFVGMPECEQIGKTDFDFFDRERAEVIREHDRPVLEEGKQLRTEEWVTYPDGRKVLLDTLKVPFYGSDGEIHGLLGICRDITERKRAEEAHLAHLRFFESMDRVNRAIQGTNDLETMMSNVLDATLTIFDCDRAWLVYPCDPKAASWQVPMERTKPEYPGANTLGLEIPMDTGIAEAFRTQLASDGPVKYGPGTEHPLPEDVSEQFGFKSFMSMAIHPKVGSPWQFGIHQCTYPRVWTSEEERLLQGIGRRLSDALTSLLAFRDLRESEERLSLTLEVSNAGIWKWNIESDEVCFDARFHAMLGYTPGELPNSLQEWKTFHHPEDLAEMLSKAGAYLHGDSPIYESEHRIRAKAGSWNWVFTRGKLVNFTTTGSPKQFIGIAMDITGRKLAEEALRKLNEELELRVKQRTAELEEKNTELARMNRIFVGRELRMVELKERIRELEKLTGG